MVVWVVTVVPSMNVTFSVNVEPTVKSPLGKPADAETKSEANILNEVPVPTTNCTLPSGALIKSASGEPANPRAQNWLFGTVSHTPTPPARLSSNRLTVPVQLLAVNCTSNIASTCPSGLREDSPGPILSKTCAS